MSPPAGTENSSEKCRLAEILQYSCDVEISGTGPQYHCWPIPRIFRICPGRPAVEVTRYVHVNGDTGEVIVPATLNQQLPKAKQWRDVIHRDPSGAIQKADECLELLLTEPRGTPVDRRTAL
ncbi:hypothetical protein ABKN59_007945 [Abortiporus biennis]